MQNYRIRSRDGKDAAPTKAYQKWFDALLQVKKDTLLPALDKAGLLLLPEQYAKANALSKDFLMEVSDFNSLIAISQSLSKPVFMLDKNDLANAGSVATNQVESAKKFRKIYDDASQKIISIYA